jgi:hypothetical protein
VRPAAIRDRGSDLLFAHAASFGALWGAVESTLGGYLHALKVPFAGTARAVVGATILIGLRVLHPRRGVIVAAGVVSAAIKASTPSTAIVGPVTGILVESCLVELVCLGGIGPVSSALAGALAALWALTQKVVVQIVLYGAPIFDLYREVSKRAEQWLSLSPGGGVRLVFAFASFVATLGALGGTLGLRAGRIARTRREARQA